MTPQRTSPAVAAGTPRCRAAVGLACALLAVQAWTALASTGRPTRPPLSPAEAQLALDPNQATPAELELLPGIGPRIAELIVAYRTASARQPAFRCAEDLDQVKRIGPATVERLRPFLRFPETPSDEESPRALDAGAPIP